MSAAGAARASSPARDRILEAFTDRARTLGPRSVVMAELARDLGISTRTLYKHFRSKSELMDAVMARFADQWQHHQAEHFERRVSSEERMRVTALRWLEMRDQFSQAFWGETRKHFPEAFDVWQKTVRRLSVRAFEATVPDMRKDAPPRLLIQLLLGAVWQAADPERCDQLGISRQESVSLAVSVWARGALEPQPAAERLEPAAGEEK